MTNKDFDPVEKPEHYNSHPSGVECIEITRHHDFAIGNAIKYVWRAGLKNSGRGIEAEIEDLKKARFCLDDKIKMLEAQHDETLDRIAREVADEVSAELASEGLLNRIVAVKEALDVSARPRTRFLEFNEVKRGMRVTVAPKRGAGNSVTGIVEYAGAVYIEVRSEATGWIAGMNKKTINTITTTEAE